MADVILPSNPLIESDDLAQTAENVRDALSYLRVADAHINGVSELGESHHAGRARFLDCIQDATEWLRATLEDGGHHG